MIEFIYYLSGLFILFIVYLEIRLHFAKKNWCRAEFIDCVIHNALIKADKSGKISIGSKEEDIDWDEEAKELKQK